VAANGKPVLSGSPPTRVRANAEFRFQPTASDPDGDPLRFSVSNLPSWAAFDAGTGRIDGRPQPSDAGSYAAITLSVTDGAHTVSLPSFGVTVQPVQDKGSISLAWTLPDRKEDGSPVAQAPVLRVHYGRQSRGYLDAVTVPQPGVTRYVLTNFDSGTWYVAMTSVDPDGVESAFSNETVAQVN
jgi:hypothetical protein